MFKINVVIENSAWKSYIKDPSYFIKEKLTNINRKDKKNKNKKLSFTLLLSGNSEIKKLNKKFRKRNRTTDILSFPFYKKEDLRSKIKKNNEVYLGDIIINLYKIKQNKNLSDFKIRFNKLWIHGLVHLLGHDHKQDGDFNKMIKIENKLFSYLD
tara:strand:+ start:650 stop:1114 length:465 start_codon:yes stop_codon:yes gene_type:complete